MSRCPFLDEDIFTQADLGRGNDVTGNTDDELIAEPLIKYQLRWNPGIRTTEDNGVGLLSYS